MVSLLNSDFFGKLYIHEKQQSYIKVSKDQLETKVTTKDDKPSMEALLKNTWDFSGTKFDTEIKSTSKALHSFKINHKTDLGATDAEIENEFTYNSDTKGMTNRFALANQLKDVDVRHQIQVTCDKDAVIRNDLTWKVKCCTHLAGHLDWTWSTRSFGELALSYIWSGDRLKKLFSYTTDLSKDGLKCCNGTFNWMVLFKATESTELGFHYNWTAVNPKQNLKLGFATKIADGVDLKGKISQCGHIDFNLKS